MTITPTVLLNSSFLGKNHVCHQITYINQAQMARTGFHIGIVLIVLQETLPVYPSVLPTDGTGPRQYAGKLLFCFHHDMIKELKANSRIMLWNREQDMSCQRPRRIWRFIGFEITFPAHALKSCHWSAMGHLFASFFFGTILNRGK